MPCIDIINTLALFIHPTPRSDTPMLPSPMLNMKLNAQTPQHNSSVQTSDQIIQSIAAQTTANTPPISNLPAPFFFAFAVVEATVVVVTTDTAGGMVDALIVDPATTEACNVRGLSDVAGHTIVCVLSPMIVVTVEGIICVSTTVEPGIVEGGTVCGGIVVPGNVVV